MKAMLPLVLVLLSGCAPWQYYDPARPGIAYSPKPAGYEMPLLARSEITRPYKEIGQISALGGSYAMQRDMYTAIRSQARAVGADALVEVHYSGARLHPDIIATAIIYTDQPHTEISLPTVKRLDSPRGNQHE